MMLQYTYANIGVECIPHYTMTSFHFCCQKKHEDGERKKKKKEKKKKKVTYKYIYMGLKFIPVFFKNGKFLDLISLLGFQTK